jgi:hypothetical protein
LLIDADADGYDTDAGRLCGIRFVDRLHQRRSFADELLHRLTVVTSDRVREAIGREDDQIGGRPVREQWAWLVQAVVPVCQCRRRRAIDGRLNRGCAAGEAAKHGRRAVELDHGDLGGSRRLQHVDKVFECVLRLRQLDWIDATGRVDYQANVQVTRPP